MFWKQSGQLLTKMSCWLAIAQTTPWVMGLFSSKAQNLSFAFIFSPVLWYISSSQRHALCLSFSDTWQCSCQFHVWQRVQKPGINCFTSKGHGNCKNRKWPCVGKQLLGRALHQLLWHTKAARNPTEVSQWISESLFLLGHLINSSKKQNFTNQNDLKTSAAPIERRWEACLLRIFMWLVKVTIWIIQWKFAPLSAYTSQCLCHLPSNSLLSHFISFQGQNKFNKHYLSVSLTVWEVGSIACEHLPSLAIHLREALPATHHTSSHLSRHLPELPRSSSHSFATTGLFQLHPTTQACHRAVQPHLQYLHASLENTHQQRQSHAYECRQVWKSAYSLSSTLVS